MLQYIPDAISNDAHYNRECKSTRFPETLVNLLFFGIASMICADGIAIHSGDPWGLQLLSDNLV